MRASLDHPALRALAGRAAGLPAEAQAAFVQRAVNHAVHARGRSYDCADDGYWAPAGETLGRGVGDCIDVAVAKMEALRLLGVPARDLYLTTGYAGGAAAARGRESAALLVRLGGAFWLLGEGNDSPIPAGAATSSQFAPIVTYGVGRTWIHGKLVRSPVPVAAASYAMAATPAR